MSKAVVILLGAVVLGLIAGIVGEHRARLRLDAELQSLRAEVLELTAQLAALRQERAPSSATPASAPPSSSDASFAELQRLRTELNELRERLTPLERSAAAVSNRLAEASGENIPFIYPDSTKRKDYAFAGYAAPASAFQSMLWAITQSDPRTYHASLAGRMAELFAKQIEELPPGVMPGGFKNGAMYRASGFRVLEETPLSEDETRLKVFLEGRQNLVLKVVMKKVGGEWKMERNE